MFSDVEDIILRTSKYCISKVTSSDVSIISPLDDTCCFLKQQVRWTRRIETDASGVTLKNILEEVTQNTTCSLANASVSSSLVGSVRCSHRSDSNFDGLRRDRAVVLASLIGSMA